MYTATTAAPARAKASQTALPRYPVPPVTTTTRFSIARLTATPNADSPSSGCRVNRKGIVRDGLWTPCGPGRARGVRGSGQGDRPGFQEGRARCLLAHASGPDRDGAGPSGFVEKEVSLLGEPRGALACARRSSFSH